MVTINQPDFNFHVTFYELIMGDVNGDKQVNVTDVVGIVSYILEDAPNGFVELAADINGDGLINVTDVVCVIRIILSDDGSNAPNSPNVVNSYEAMPTVNESLTVGEFTDRGFAVNLASAKDYVACQMDITVDDGANITGIALDAARTLGHAVNYTRLASGKYRVVVYSPSLERIAVGEGTLFNVATDRSIGSLKIEDIRFVTADMAETMFDAIDISSADIAKYYSGIGVKAIGDKLVVTSDRDILLPLYSTSGRLVRLLDVKAGRSVFVGFHKDVYVINRTKVIIK